MNQNRLSWHSMLGFSACFAIAACGGAAKPTPKPPQKVVIDAVKPAPEPTPDPIATQVCSQNKDAKDTSSVIRVEIRGRGAPALLCEKVVARQGNPLDPTTTDLNVRALYAEGRVEDVVVFQEKQAEGVVVVYEVKIRRRIRSIKVRPVEGLEQSVADELVTDAPLWEDNARFDALVRDATETLISRGYRRTSISIETSPEGDDEVNVTLNVEPGPRVKVAAFNVDGFSPARWAEISALLQTKVGEPFNQELLERDVLVMTADLFDRGLVSAEFSSPKIVESPDGSQVNILLQVTEGPVYKMRQIKFVGDLIGKPSVYLSEAWKTKSGAVFSRKNIVEDVESVKRLHVKRGMPADVDIETSIDPKSHTVDVTVRIKRSQ